MKSGPEPAADLRSVPRRLLLPVVGIVGVAVLVAAVQAVLAVRKFDEHILHEEQHLAGAAIRQIVSDLRQGTLDYTWWDESVRRIVISLDTPWASHLWGYYQENYRGNQLVMALAADGRVIMTWSDGRARFGGEPLGFEPDIGPMIAAARESPVTDPEPRIAWAWHDGALYAVSVGAITPSDPVWANAYGPDRAVGVFARRLDAQLDTWVREDFMLEGLDVLPPGTGTGAARLDLPGPDGATVATLVWDPRESGRTFMEAASLPAAAVLLSLLPLMIIFVRRAVRLTAEQAALRGRLEREREVGTMKSRFVSMVSHEFRTPLTSIMASTELLQHYRDRLSDDEKTTELQAIQQEIDRLTRMIDDVITLGHADATGLEFRPAAVELDGLLQDIVDRAVLTTSSACDVAIHGAQEIGSVSADANLLTLAAGNVIANALKYSPGGEPVDVQASRSGDMLTIVVVDRGIGVPADDLERLGRPFYRAGNATRISGTGLGLAIARSAVEAHGGRLAIESELGRGTRVTLSFRLTADPT